MLPVVGLVFVISANWWYSPATLFERIDSAGWFLLAGGVNVFYLVRLFVPSCLVKRIPPDSEGLRPRFSSRWIDVTETITKRGGSSFYLTKETFDSIPIPMANRLESELSSVQCSR